ncbi:MAG: hypothetical protein HDT19_04390 [Oscillibacter sp.]|nr:hypothetical protein [Oscillibacter sp.]
MTVGEMAVAQRMQEYEKSKPTEAEKEAAHKRIDKQLQDMGYAIEGMCLNCYGAHKHDKVELPDSVVQQVKDAAFASAKDGYGWNDTDYLSPIVKSYVKTVAVDKRLASSYSLEKVWRKSGVRKWTALVGISTPRTPAGPYGVSTLMSASWMITSRESM